MRRKCRLGRFEINARAMLSEQPLTLANDVLAGVGSLVRSEIVCAAETVTGFESSDRIIADCLSCPWLSEAGLLARDVCLEHSLLS